MVGIAMVGIAMVGIAHPDMVGPVKGYFGIAGKLFYMVF
jgi:hypothetical protein